MGLVDWLRRLSYSGYDRQGNAKYLLGRAANDPDLCDVEGVPASARDEALNILCDSFDIPERQMYCLRPDDQLMAIYESFVGPRTCDDMQLERVQMSIEEIGGPRFTDEEAVAIRTVGDVMRVVAERRAAAATAEPQER